MCEASVADEQKLKRLFAELQRVGVDPNTFSAVLGVRSDEALRVLAALPDGAGPSAFLTRLRQDATQRGAATEEVRAPMKRTDDPPAGAVPRGAP